jgi:RHS repeat-associated protein
MCTSATKTLPWWKDILPACRNLCRQDDVVMTYTPTNVIQYNEYYPFGLQTANSWTRTNTTQNNFLYNEGSELNTTSGLYDLPYRTYDPVLGRMNGVDPMASKYGSLTPYNYAANDPVYWTDPSGADMLPFCTTCGGFGIEMQNGGGSGGESAGWGGYGSSGWANFLNGSTSETVSSWNVDFGGSVRVQYADGSYRDVFPSTIAWAERVANQSIESIGMEVPIYGIEYEIISKTDATITVNKYRTIVGYRTVFNKLQQTQNALQDWLPKPEDLERRFGPDFISKFVNPMKSTYENKDFNPDDLTDYILNFPFKETLIDTDTKANLRLYPVEGRIAIGNLATGRDFLYDQKLFNVPAMYRLLGPNGTVMNPGTGGYGVNFNDASGNTVWLVILFNVVIPH